MRGIAEEDDIAVAPTRAAHAQKSPPRVAHAVRRRVELQRMPIEPRREELLARRDRLCRVHPVKAGAAPRCFVALHDEGRLRVVEAIGVHLEDARRGLEKDEGEGVEAAGGAEPDVAVASHIGHRAEGLAEGAPHEAVHPVGRDNEIGALGAERRDIRELLPIAKDHT